MILLRQASPIVNGVPALLYHYGDPSGCRHSPSSDNKQWPHGYVHWSFYSWWILKIQGQSMGSLATLTAVPLGLGSNAGKDMDVCKCIVPSWYGGTLNSRRAASLLVRLVEGEEKWQPLTTLRVFFLKIWVKPS
ncbi:uncharacterized protein TNCV_1213781 [Trichonephila clavipes]|nr:uncharacterized protein TNCV_1213781 [Trichonephila clavipes]